MRASIVCVTEKNRGLDLLVNGFMGQVEFSHNDNRQFFNPKTNQLEIAKDDRQDKRLNDFELIVADISRDGEWRVGEVEAARLLCTGRHGDKYDATRLLPGSTRFKFEYLPMPGASYWDALCAAFAKVKAEQIVIVVPDLSYAPPHFIEANLIALAEKKLLGGPRLACAVATVVTRVYPALLDGGVPVLGALLDPTAETLGEPACDARQLDPALPFHKIAAAGFRVADLADFKSLQPPPVGYELNALALWARKHGAVEIQKGENFCLLRLDPKCLGLKDPEPVPTSYVDWVAQRRTA